MGKLRERLSAWANSEDQDRRDMREEYGAKDCAAIAAAPDRQPVQLRGTLRTVTLRPRGGVPALEAELFDGSGMVTVIWLGRRRIAGISPGRSIQVAGRIGLQDGVRVLYNPRYELIP
ncbi:OB-fold nucleic acid binding domain-containing protein [Nocardioides sp. Kera G14]|uniref:OB-fold nucleic acid binding domain-containing protein n=1 Tax=Nocardioides sp. Kera G14 TaxID=2884264 RepID=UPI001D1105FF|nr:OB-fold nucleic acid binding domain-containing protein [Nocardioides sp. Kera G14]UDY22362.1 OB-fold nucleic acid binding domain-containing protein [Nocardioides sp. Kera G14]